MKSFDSILRRKKEENKRFDSTLVNVVSNYPKYHFEDDLNGPPGIEIPCDSYQSQNICNQDERCRWKQFGGPCNKIHQDSDIKLPINVENKRILKVDKVLNDDFKSVLLDCKEFTTDEVSNDEMFRHVVTMIDVYRNAVDESLENTYKNLMVINQLRNEGSLKLSESSQAVIMAENLKTVSKDYDEYQRKKGVVYNKKLKKLGINA